MRFVRTLIPALALAAAAAAPLGAQEPGRIPIERYTLPNGLTVILSENHSAQVVAVDVWYHVGSRNERPGRTGFAHLFEHMMFQGSAHAKKGSHSTMLEQAGSVGLNGSTTEDRTNYYEPVPSNRMNLALWLEADRMRSLNITDTNFNNQREAVKEERRLRVDNQPYNKAVFEDEYVLFDSATCYPYSHSIIGSMDDLNAAKTADVKAFFDLYYAPNNATLVVAGDFEPAEAKRLIQQYFGDIPRGAEPPPVVCNAQFNTGPIRKSVKDVKANLPAVIQVYRVPATRDADFPALDLLARILGSGESSRLNRSLQREQKLAVATPIYLDPFGPRNGPGPFLFWTIANQGVSVDALDKALAAEVGKIGTDGVSEAELTKAKNTYRAELINQRQTSQNIAELLQSADYFLGGADKVNSDFSRYMAVTTADIKRVAAKYLRPDNALTMIVTPEGK